MFRTKIRVVGALAVAAAGLVQPIAGISAAAQTAVPKPVPDLNCAGAFRVNAVLEPSAERPSLRAARLATRKYLESRPSEDPTDLEAFMAGRTEPTVKRLQSSADDMAQHEETLVACARQYALDPADLALTDMAARVAKRAGTPTEDKRTPQQIFSAAEYAYFVEKRRDEGLSLYRRACERNHALACKTYGSLVKADRSPAAQKEAVWGLDRGCQLGEAAACLEHAALVDPLTFFGDKALQDWTAAERSYRRACQTLGDREACEPLAKLLRASRNPQPKIAEGTAILRKLCDEGRTDICAKLAAEAVRGQ